MNHECSKPKDGKTWMHGRIRKPRWDCGDTGRCLRGATGGILAWFSDFYQPSDVQGFLSLFFFFHGGDDPRLWPRLSKWYFRRRYYPSLRFSFSRVPCKGPSDGGKGFLFWNGLIFCVILLSKWGLIALPGADTMQGGRGDAYSLT